MLLNLACIILSLNGLDYGGVGGVGFGYDDGDNNKDEVDYDDDASDDDYDDDDDQNHDDDDGTPNF